MNGPADAPLDLSIPLRAGRPDVIDETFEGEAHAQAAANIPSTPRTSAAGGSGS